MWLLQERAQDLHAYAERFVLSIKSECLERMILFGEASLHRAIREYMSHYHAERAVNLDRACVRAPAVLTERLKDP